MRFKPVIFTAAVFFLLIGQRIFAQEQRTFGQPAKPFWDRIYLGGSFGLQFGNYTIVDLAPQIGYRITDRLTSGIGITYIYLKYTDPTYNYSFSTNVYGGSIFSKYLVYHNFFIYAELQQLNTEVFDYFTDEYSRVWVPAFFIGGGLMQPIGERTSFQILLLYDVVQDPNSIYVNPIIRVGFGFGF